MACIMIQDFLHISPSDSHLHTNENLLFSIEKMRAMDRRFHHIGDHLKSLPLRWQRSLKFHSYYYFVWERKCNGIKTFYSSLYFQHVQ